MSNLYDEIADTMAASWTVGRHVNRDDIMKALRAKFKTEDELRAAFNVIKAETEQTIKNLEADGSRVVGIAQAAPKKDMH